MGDTQEFELTADGKKIKERLPMTGVRRMIAANLENSWRTAVTTTGFVKYDCTAIKNLKDMLYARDIKVSYTEIFIMLTAAAIKASPLVNSAIVEKKLEVYESINMGVAVATNTGMLLVPVIRDVQDKNLLDVTKELADIKERARDGAITPEDMAGGTITISSMGMFDTYGFSQVLTGNQSFILGFGSIRKEPVVVEDDKIAVRPMIHVNASMDHRIIHGASGSAFMLGLGEGFKDPEKYMKI